MFTLPRPGTIRTVLLHRRRNELFSTSGIRANYPQFFLVDEDQTISFLGDYEKINAVNDASSLPEEVLDANPSIMTWDKVMGSSSSVVTAPS